MQRIRHSYSEVARLQTSANARPAALGSFVVRRHLMAVVMSTSEDSIINRLLAAAREGNRRQPGVALLSPPEAFVAVDQPDMTPTMLRDRLILATREFPPELTGWLGKVAILGVAAGRPGNRYVAFNLASSLRDSVQDERRELHYRLGMVLPGHTPHMSVLQTTDHQLALETADELREATNSGVKVVLGEPSVVPVVRSR
ncbi:hypothetical protein HY346_01540 [Candidatus Microgenomates bacterium]|nr:hypothetical protein [Candidatus Microgenomates bacterium]